eukprot:scaffold121791_cov87-Phaeocystis_antarctica.AAC.1
MHPGLSGRDVPQGNARVHDPRPCLCAVARGAPKGVLVHGPARSPRPPWLKCLDSPEGSQLQRQHAPRAPPPAWATPTVSAEEHKLSKVVCQ